MLCAGTKAGDKYFEENGFLDHQFSVPRLKQGIFLVFSAVGKGAGTGCAGHKMLSLYHLVPRFRFLAVLFILINFCIFSVTNRVEIRFGLNLDPSTNPFEVYDLYRNWSCF